MAGSKSAEAAITDAASSAVSGRRRQGTSLRPSTSATPDKSEPEQIAKGLHDLRFSLREQIAYHGARELFLARLGRTLTGLQVLLGTSAVAMMAEVFPDYALASVVAAALTGVLLLVIDPAGAAREHRVLRGRFHEIMADCEEGDCSEQMLRQARAKVERINASAPPAYRAVQAIAYNMAVNATYREPEAASYRYKVGVTRRLFANWFAMRGMPFSRENVHTVTPTS
jgi:hypothetical protein